MTLRKGLDLNLTSLDDGFTICPHGNYNTFKTYLGGSMIQWVLSRGGKAVFLNISGEDGYRTLANFPAIVPSEHIWEADDYKAIEEAQTTLEKEPVTALVVDSGKVFAEKVALKVTGDVARPLRVSNEKGVSNTDWPDMHYYLPQMIQRLRRCAKYVMVTCSSDIAADPLDTEGQWFAKKSRQVRPDFPGKSSGFSRGWFDFLAYCEVDASLGSINRSIHFEYDDRFSTRARVVVPFKRPIKLLEGPNCWEAVYKELEAHCVRPTTTEQPTAKRERVTL